MADATYHTEHAPRRTILQSIGGFFASIGHGLVAIGENSSRYRRLQALNALTDAQLAERGMQREDIVRHVFADVYYV